MERAVNLYLFKQKWLQVNTHALFILSHHCKAYFSLHSIHIYEYIYENVFEYVYIHANHTQSCEKYTRFHKCYRGVERAVSSKQPNDVKEIQ